MLKKINFFTNFYYGKFNFYKVVLMNSKIHHYAIHNDDVVIKNNILCSFVIGTRGVVYCIDGKYHPI